MAEIINLRQARKRKQRQEKSRKADINRICSSIPKREKTARLKQKAHENRILDGHLLEDIPGTILPKPEDQ